MKTIFIVTEMKITQKVLQTNKKFIIKAVLNTKKMSISAMTKNP